MAEKYYEPEISELCYGLTCEVQRLLGVWEKIEVDDVIIVWVRQWFQPTKKPGNLRVKYLDSDDIHSCGFETKGDGNRLWKNAKNYSLVHNPGGIVVIEDDSDDCLFYGKIKNKSELKKLLQMLEIN